MHDTRSAARTTAARNQELLRAASLLLARGSYLHAVHALHSELRSVGNAEVTRLTEPEKYTSTAQAEAEHRRLLFEFGKQTAAAHWGRSLRDSLRRAPPWAGWALLLTVVGVLSLRYVLGVLDSKRWQGQHPEGNWISRYYSNMQFKGFPLVRYDVGVNYDFGPGAPAQEMSADQWSARWDTCIVVTKNLDLTLSVAADDRARVFLDGVPQLEIGPKPGRKSATVQFRKGLRHFGVEFVEDQGMAMIRLDGLNFAGSDGYHFQRPRLDGEDLRCE